MTLITADKIHDGKNWMPPGTVLDVSPDGTIRDFPAPATVPPDRVQRLSGIICPGFVNVHCHLELSYLKGAIREGTGLVPFLSSVMQQRQQVSPEVKIEMITDALAEMQQNGIVALGDIANTNDTAKIRLAARMHVHTFIEALGMDDKGAERRFAHSEELYRKFVAGIPAGHRYRLRQSIVPHAPYSISRKLFSLIDRFDPTSLLSIHNQETAAETAWFQSKSGAFAEFYRQLAIDVASFAPSGRSSIQTYLPWLSEGHPLLLIHNTFMKEADYAFLTRARRRIHLGLCPGANQYIEQKLPPLSLFKKEQLPVCLGTDSLASNWELSIFAEMHRLKNGIPDLDWETLIRWGTFNGAAALEMADLVGSIAPGKKPGLVQLHGPDYKQVNVLFNA